MLDKLFLNVIYTPLEIETLLLLFLFFLLLLNS